MCPHNPDNDSRAHPDSAGDADGNVVPLRRSAGRAGVTVDRIETEPMTQQEHQRAVITLATLINQWQHAAENRAHNRARLSHFLGWGRWS